MHRRSVSPSDADKSARRFYRVGEFLITRVGSRWHISARHSAPGANFATLGGAIAWCRQKSVQAIPHESKPRATAPPPIHVAVVDRPLASYNRRIGKTESPAPSLCGQGPTAENPRCRWWEPPEQTRRASAAATRKAEQARRISVGSEKEPTCQTTTNSNDVFVSAPF